MGGRRRGRDTNQASEVPEIASRISKKSYSGTSGASDTLSGPPLGQGSGVNTLRLSEISWTRVVSRALRLSSKFIAEAVRHSHSAMPRLRSIKPGRCCAPWVEQCYFGYLHIGNQPQCNKQYGFNGSIFPDRSLTQIFGHILV